MNDKIVYDKLVRDKIPEIIKQSGKECVTHIASEEAYQKRLLQKLIEESNEMNEDPSIEELSDVLEVIDCIKTAFNFKDKDIQKMKLKKASERGSFLNRIVLEAVGK